MVDAAPSASSSYNCQAQRSNCTFDGSASSDDGGIVSYSWDFGDATAAVRTSNSSVSHKYDAKGTYSAKLTVTDVKGQSSTTSRSVIVRKK